VDGVYTKDPIKFDDAVKLESVSYQKALENPAIKVMDKAALGLAAEQNMEIVVYKLDEPDALSRIVAGEKVGTKIS